MFERVRAFVCVCVCVCVCVRVNDVGIEMEVIDSCANGNGGCEQVCHHSNDGTTCSCHDGYTLKPDRKSCEGTAARSAPSYSRSSTGRHNSVL